MFPIAQVAHIGLLPSGSWNFTLPGTARGSEAEIGAVFDKVARNLEAALSTFVLLPLEEFNRDEWSSLAYCVPVKI